MLIETAIKTHLLAQTGVTALVGDRIYYQGEVPQRATAPYLVISMISAVRVQTREINTNLARPHLQFSAFASTYGAAKNLLDAVYAVLQGYKGTMGGVGGVNVHSALYQDQSELDRGDSTGLYGLADDYEIWHGQENTTVLTTEAGGALLME
jgi:hypothetical protein